MNQNIPLSHIVTSSTHPNASGIHARMLEIESEISKLHDERDFLMKLLCPSNSSSPSLESYADDHVTYPDNSNPCTNNFPSNPSLSSFSS